MEISLKMGGGTTIVFLFYQNEKSIDINSLFFTVEFKLLVHASEFYYWHHGNIFQDLSIY